MTVEMIASKRFRLAQEKGFRWLNAGDPYTVSTEKTADYHEQSGRGKRKSPPKPETTQKPVSGKAKE